MPRSESDHVAADFLTVGEAATKLGVSRSTLRNWDKAGKLKPHRHPLNDYRLYRRVEVEELLARIIGVSRSE
jgi:excisionase family DNA binding protein